MSAPRHIAVLPARAGSKGIPGKNRLLFGLNRDFLRTPGLFDRVIMTSDDDALLGMAAAEGWETRRRPDALADDHASIKDAFVDLVQNVDLQPDDYLWLVFMVLVYKDPEDFRSARAILDRTGAPGLCSFRAARTHPFVCWRIDRETNTVRHFIDNDLYNRQDFPEAWENYNYLCAIKVSELASANANLVSERSYPVLMSPELAAKQVELDEPEDFELWRRTHPDDYARWLASLPPGTVLPSKEK